jgi:hypothetical protein
MAAAGEGREDGAVTDIQTSSPIIPWALAACLLSLAWLPGCPTDPTHQPPPGDDDDATGDDDGGDDDGSDDDGGDDDTMPSEEDICDDGIDNDGDGPTDCEDPDCDAFIPCTWPQALNHNARFVFVAQAQWLENCETRFSSHMTLGAQIGPCPSCDQTYEGPYNYSINSCADLLDMAGVDLPDYGAYGMIFVSDNQRDVWTRNTDGVWESLGMANYVQAIGHFELERVDNMQNIGTLTTTLTFSDGP